MSSGIALRGQHQDGQRLSFGAQTAADFEAVLLADHQIEHQQIIRLALQIAVEPLAVFHDAHFESVAGEKPLQHVAQFGFVVEHDDFRGPSMRGSLAVLQAVLDAGLARRPVPCDRAA